MNSNLAYEYELPVERIDGKPVAMSPRPSINHNRISGDIFGIFRHYLRRKPCEPFADGSDLYLSEKDHFIPDMMVVCDKDKIKGDAIYGAPALVVEVLSPGTAKRDRGYKKEAYEAAGVREYWIVSPTGFSIEVYLLKDGAYELDEIYSIYPEAELKKMTEEEKAAIPKSFHCNLFPDLEIVLEDVFWRLL